MSVRVRFAPSPTGHLHVGNLRTALFNWLFARHHKGVFLVRIEDTDRQRYNPAYTQSILESLSWCDINPDEPILIQSTRTDEHIQIAHQLVSQGKAYRCYCTEEEIIARAKKMHGDEYLFASYDRKCLLNPPTDTNASYVIRFKIPNSISDVTFHDLIRGSVSVPVTELDDFIIVRSDGNPIYNFVVVLDDAFMKITHVIRGEDHISNTIKQLLLYQACGYDVPHFAHLPMILGPSGDRLSKRDGAVSVIDYKHEGYLAQGLLNYLARLGWSHGDQEIFSRQELIDYFSLDAIGKKGAVFDRDKLLWVNGMHMRLHNASYLEDKINADVMPDYKEQLHAWSQEQRHAALHLYQDRTQTLKELANQVIGLYQGPVTYNAEDTNKWITSQVVAFLPELIDTLQEVTSFDESHIKKAIQEFAQRHEVKLVACAQPLRIALIGSSDGPGVFSLLAVLKKEESLKRVRKLLKELR